MNVLSDSNHIIRKVGTNKTQRVYRMRLRLFKPEFPIDDMSLSKQICPDDERVEDTGIIDSNIPTHDEVDQNKIDNLDQDLVDNEPSEERINRTSEPSRTRSQDRTPGTPITTDNPPVEDDFSDFRPLTVRFGTQEESILPPHAMKVG